MQIGKKDHRKYNIFVTYAVLMSMIGIWPLSEDKLFRKVQNIFCALQLMLASIGIILQLSKTSNNMFCDYIDSFIALAYIIMAATKVFSLNVFKKEFAIILNCAHADWSTTKNKEDIKIMKNHLQGFNKTAILFYSTLIPSLVISILRPFILGVSSYSEDRGNETITVIPCNYIYPSDYIYDKRNAFVYHGMLFNQIIQVILLASINCGVDLMFISAVTHLCGQIDVLIRYMTELGESSSADQYLDNIIKRHQQLMNLVHILEDIFYVIILTQIIMSIGLICVGGFGTLFSLEAGDIITIFKSLMIVQFMLVENYLYAYPADNLMNTGEKMLRGIYSSYWYEMPNKVTKKLVFIMMRLHIPPSITVGKFFNLTRVSYTVVIKTSASYLSVLRLLLRHD